MVLAWDSEEKIGTGSFKGQCNAAYCVASFRRKAKIRECVLELNAIRLMLVSN